MNKKLVSIAIFVALTAFVWLGFAGGQYFYERSLFTKGNIPDTPEAKEIMSVMDRAYQLLGQASRSFDTSEFPAVFIDTNDYKLTRQQREAIAEVLGVSADEVKNAGYLTAMQAQYISISQGTMGIPVTANKTVLIFESIEISGDRAIVRYDDGAALQEAILVKINGRWFIASIVPIWVHF